MEICLNYLNCSEGITSWWQMVSRGEKNVLVYFCSLVGFHVAPSI